MIGHLDDVAVLDSRQFLIAVRRLADSIGYGTDRSPYLGTGLEYVQSRLYQPGDPVKQIDWRLTARTRKPHVKEYETPRRVPIWLLVDTSASMTIGGSRPTKYGTAVFLAGGIALAGLERLSPVGLLGVGGRSLRVRPSLEKDQVLGWLHKLRTHRYDEPTNFASTVYRLLPQIEERSLFVVISDLHEPEAVSVLKRVAGRHECVVLRLRDPGERGMRGVGFVRAQEAETGRRFVTRGGYCVEFDDAPLKRAAIEMLDIDIDRPYVARLKNFFQARGGLGRGVR